MENEIRWTDIMLNWAGQASFGGGNVVLIVISNNT